MNFKNQQLINEDTEIIRNKLININKDTLLTNIQRIKETMKVALYNFDNKNKLRQYKAKKQVMFNRQLLHRR